MGRLAFFLGLMILASASGAWAQFPNTAFYRHRVSSLKFTTTAQSLATWNCSGVVTVQAQNASGVAQNVASTTTVNLSGSGTLTFYSDPACTSSITTVSILSGQSSADFYFLDTSAGSSTATASATGYQNAVQTETLTASQFIWTGGGGNSLWSTGANWSGGAAPGPSDAAIFNSSCSSNCSPTISANVDVAGVRISSGYTGTITQNSGASITIHTKNWIQAGGTFVGSSGSDNMIIYGDWYLSGGSFTAPRGTLAITYMSTKFVVSNNPTFNHNSGTFQFDNCPNPIITPGNITFYNVYGQNGCNWSGSTLNGTMKIAGDLTLESSSYQGTFGSGGTVNLSGNLISRSQGWGIASNCYLRLVGGIGSNVTITASGTSGSPIGSVEFASLGTINLVNSIIINGDFTYTSGTVNAGTSVVMFGGYGNTQNLNPGAMVFYDTVFRADAYNSVNLTGTMHVDHDFTLGAIDGRSGMGGGVVEVKHNVISTSPVNNGSTAISFVGSSNQSVSATAGSNFFSGNITVATTGGAIVTLGSSIDWSANGQTLNVTSGGINMAGYGLNLKALSLNGNTITRNAGTLTVNGTAVAAGTQSVYGGTVAP